MADPLSDCRRRDHSRSWRFSAGRDRLVLGTRPWYVAVSFDSKVQVFDNVGVIDDVTVTGPSGGLAFDSALNLLVANTVDDLVEAGPGTTHAASTIGHLFPHREHFRLLLTGRFTSPLGKPQFCRRTHRPGVPVSTSSAGCPDSQCRPIPRLRRNRSRSRPDTLRGQRGSHGQERQQRELSVRVGNRQRHVHDPVRPGHGVRNPTSGTGRCPRRSVSSDADGYCRRHPCGRRQKHQALDRRSIVIELSTQVRKILEELDRYCGRSEHRAISGSFWGVNAGTLPSFASTVRPTAGPGDAS